MTEFAYNNAKNINTSHTLFKLNYGYHFCMLYEKEVDSRFQSKSADKFSEKLKELIIVFCKNLHHTQEL